LQIIEEELEDGELPDSDDEVASKVSSPKPGEPTSAAAAVDAHRKKPVQELEDGEIVSSDDEDDDEEDPNPPPLPVAARKPPPAAAKKLPPGSAVATGGAPLKDKRGTENKENRADKKKGDFLYKIRFPLLNRMAFADHIKLSNLAGSTSMFVRPGTQSLQVECQTCVSRTCPRLFLAADWGRKLY